MNNPLTQYFRRPGLYLKLPSLGKYYPTGSIALPESGEIPIFPMTAIDEITSKTPDALFNGSAVVDIIKSCAPAIKDPWDMPLCDMESILIAIRAATNGNDLEVTSTCPAENCKEESKYGINIVSLLAGISVAGYDTQTKFGELAFKFKPILYRNVNQGNMAQFTVQKEIAEIQKIENMDEKAVKSTLIMTKLTEMNIELLSKSIESITLPTGELVTDQQHIIEYFHKCDKKSYEAIRSQALKCRADASIKPIKVKCVACSHEYEYSIELNITDFFV